ncbi:GNAT family N-acetyltransferase [Pendulispora albinea]|uniref:GNAT family N-acetyltransferase n=1 Tax=Pendulispora albinea TaxID=2741071 RepID=A0ABZ2LNQ2_9BACT
MSKPTDEEIVYRRANHDDPADRERILGILREYLTSVGEPGVADARYQWLYRKNPALTAYTFLASDRATREVVGLTSLFPRPVWVHGQTFLGAIGGDGYVTPRYRRRGIITRLHSEALRVMSDRDEAVSFMYGPPEPNNLKALLHAGASRVGQVQRFVRPLDADGFGARVTAHMAQWAAPLRKPLAWALSPRRSKLRLLELGDQPDARVDRVWHATVDAFEGTKHVIPVRDAPFYAWRFGPSSEGGIGRQRGYLVLDGETPVAAVALERHEGKAAIVDVTAPPRWLARTYRAIFDACRDVASIHFEVHTPCPRLQMTLYRLGFLPRTSKPFQVHVGPHHPAYDALVRPNAWRYMWGDGDVTRVL